MNTQKLMNTARKMIADDKGCWRWMKVIQPATNDLPGWGFPDCGGTARLAELIVTTPGLGESISGAILYDETIRQQTKDGTSFVKVIADAGIIPGIKLIPEQRTWQVIPKRK